MGSLAAWVLRSQDAKLGSGSACDHQPRHCRPRQRRGLLKGYFSHVRLVGHSHFGEIYDANSARNTYDQSAATRPQNSMPVRPHGQVRHDPNSVKSMTPLRPVTPRAYYDQQRARGAGHQAALRSLAFKWIRIIFRCWKKREEYDEVKYLQALKKAGSDVLNYIGAGPVHAPAGG